MLRYLGQISVMVDPNEPEKSIVIQEQNDWCIVLLNDLYTKPHGEGAIRPPGPDN